MTLLPIIEKLEELKANDIYGAEIVDAIKSSNLNLYFYYDGFVGLTDNQVDCKDLDKNIFEVVRYEGYLKLDNKAFNIKNIYNIVRSLDLMSEFIVNTAINGDELVCLLNGSSNINLPAKFGEFFSKKINLDLNLKMNNLFVERKCLLNLLGGLENEKAINNNFSIENDEDIGGFTNVEEYLRKLSEFNKSNLNGDFPKKIMVIIDAYCSMYVENKYYKTEKNLKHTDLFQLCAMDLDRKYDINQTFIKEIEKITNPKPQYVVTDKK